MANSVGFCEAILIDLQDIVDRGYPGNKVTPPGFTTMLYNQPNRPTPIQDGYQNGHRRGINVKYMVRNTRNYVSTSPSCDQEYVPAFKETTASATNYVQTAITLEDDTIRQYCTDLSRMVAFGEPRTQVMQMVMTSILHAMNGLYQEMDRTLLTAMAARFGVNTRTGLATSTGVNFALDGTQNNLQANWTQIGHDILQNEICGVPIIVGSGNFAAWDMQRKAAAMSFNQSGINQGQVADYQFFYDRYAQTQWGDNQIGVFEPGTVHIVEDIRNVGSFAGNRGESTFFTMMDPRAQCWSPAGMSFVTWDVQHRFINCPTTVNDGYAGGTTTITRGQQIIIGKYFGLFTIPTDAYDGADIIAGQNGTLRYTITNA